MRCQCAQLAAYSAQLAACRTGCTRGLLSPSFEITAPHDKPKHLEHLSSLAQHQAHDQDQSSSLRRGIHCAL